MEDLFANEQKIFEDAAAYAHELQNGAAFEPGEFDKLVREYGRLLRQLRRATRISDRATGNLNVSKVDLQGKVHNDALTGIYNRRFLEENTGRLINTIARQGGHIGIMMIDIDHFKKYNDTYGHSEGDVCLRKVAQAISGSLLRGDDLAVRYGGEEFSVILPNTDESGTRLMAGKILESVRALGIPHEKNEAAGCVTVSVGATSALALPGQKIDEYLKRADEALYKSKEDGRNRYTFLEWEADSSP